MIDVTKFASAAQANRTAPPVDPVRQANPTSGEEPRKAAEAAITNIRDRTQRGEPDKQEDLKKLAESMNDFMQASDLGLRISVDEATQIFITKIVNEKTGEVVRQFPSDEMVKIAARLKEQVNGVFVDEKS